MVGVGGAFVLLVILGIICGCCCRSGATRDDDKYNQKATSPDDIEMDSVHVHTQAPEDHEMVEVVPRRQSVFLSGRVAIPPPPPRVSWPTLTQEERNKERRRKEAEGKKKEERKDGTKILGVFVKRVRKEFTQ